MLIRPATPSDLPAVADIDGTIQSSDYLHVDVKTDGLAATWQVEKRSLRQKKTNRNPMSDETAFLMKQIVTGADEGLALVAEHDDQIVAAAVARHDLSAGALAVPDLRVDFDFRRQGLASAIMFQLIEFARGADLRAVAVQTLTDNLPAALWLQKLGFELSGLDMRRVSNHDLVKETVTLFWYVPLG